MKHEDKEALIEVKDLRRDFSLNVQMNQSPCLQSTPYLKKLIETLKFKEQMKMMKILVQLFQLVQ